MPVVAWRERNFLLLLLLPKNLLQEINYTERTRYTRVKQHLLGYVCVCVSVYVRVFYGHHSQAGQRYGPRVYPPYWPYNAPVAAAVAAFLERQPQSLQYKLLCGSKLMPANFAECSASTG